MTVEYSARAKVWLYPGAAAWHFVTLSKRLAGQIRDQRWNAPRKGWNSVPVQVTLGKTTWRTSIFPEGTSGSFVLPIKKSVRKAEGIEAGDMIRFRLEVS